LVFVPSGYVVMFPLASDFALEATPVGIVEEVDALEATATADRLTGSPIGSELRWSSVRERPCMGVEDTGMLLVGVEDTRFGAGPG
jgi:hypothetical protein